MELATEADGHHHQGAFYGYRECPICHKPVWVLRDGKLERHQIFIRKPGAKHKVLEVINCSGSFSSE